jgi:multiple sugar transport system permease protein
MATLALPDERPADPTGPAARSSMSPWQRWGLILLAPYALVFVIFVMYPVGYGLWLARHPASYEKLIEDPVFLRAVFNTLAFLLIAINVKMMVALVLSGFFVVARPWIKWLSLLFILPWAVPSIPTILPSGSC